MHCDIDITNLRVGFLLYKLSFDVYIALLILYSFSVESTLKLWISKVLLKGKSSMIRNNKPLGYHETNLIIQATIEGLTPALILERDKLVKDGVSHEDATNAALAAMKKVKQADPVV